MAVSYPPGKKQINVGERKLLIEQFLSTLLSAISSPFTPQLFPTNRRLFSKSVGLPVIRASGDAIKNDMQTGFRPHYPGEI